MALSKRSAKPSRFSPIPRVAALVAMLFACSMAAFLLPHSVSAQQSGGSLFGALFGSWGSSSQPRGRYNTPNRGSPYGYRSPYSNGSPYGESYDFSNWFGGSRPQQSSYSRYRTLCVRTCDGYYFPISFSTTRAGIAHDAKQCEARCGGGRLFYHRNPGADVQHMVDLKGQYYANMENAFRYRAELVEGCRCKPEPWSEAAHQEYRRRAEAEANGEPPTAVAAAQQESDVAQPQTEVAGWTSSDQVEQPMPRRARRTGYRANDPSLEGQWWADHF